jgi:class 3 adenylate cyclase
MHDHTAEHTGLKLARSLESEASPNGTTVASGAQTGAQEQRSVDELMQLRAHIDQELNQRLTQHLCLLFADVVGSTSFYQKYGDVEGRLFVQRHYDLLAPLVAEHGGKVIKTIGDAVMASFDEPKPALDCSIALQERLWEANQRRADDTPLQTKISLHYGSALVEAHDVYGDLVNMSARLNDMTEPDQIVFSQSVYDRIKGQTNLPILPLQPVRWQKGTQGLAVYEILWRPKADVEDVPRVFRDFSGNYQGCFYCDLREHPVTNCPSKELTRATGQLKRLGYLPLQNILNLFRQEDLNTLSPKSRDAAHISDAFYEVSLPYQLRFLTRVWLATGDDWREVERQQTATASPLAGTRVWIGVDCLRVGRLDEAQQFLLAALDSNPRDYKPHIVLGFRAMEQADPATALRHWRQGLSLANNDLQAIYLHFLMYRLYAINGKTQLAQQELQKALSKDSYLYEARYRQIALLAHEGKDDKVLTQLEKLIQDDREVYLKVSLDPAFSPLQSKIHPLLSRLGQEARVAALDHMHHVTEMLNMLRAWYPQPEPEILAAERAVAQMRRQIKTESYFGYRDAIDAGESLPKRMQTLLSRRKTHLHNAFTTTLDTTPPRLRALACSPRFAEKGSAVDRLVKLQKELSRLQTLTQIDTANQFWHAWERLQQLNTAVQELASSTQQRGSGRRGKTRSLWDGLLFCLGGSIIAAATIFAVLGFLVYFAHLELSEYRLLLFLSFAALGGFLAGGSVDLLRRWLRSGH